MLLSCKHVDVNSDRVILIYIAVIGQIHPPMIISKSEHGPDTEVPSPYIYTFDCQLRI